MKIVVIGDIHGHDSWQRVLNHEKSFDKVIFLGDYWDSFSVNSKDQEENYIEIQKFRDGNPDKVVTLLGNHDYHYLYPTKYSGWKLNTKLLASPLLEADIRVGKLPYIYRHEDIIFSHAGVTKYWMDKVAQCTLEELEKGEVQLRHFDWNGRLGQDPYGDTISNSPIWVRPYSLKQDFLEGYKQVVGHTNSTGLKNVYNFMETLYFCDCLPAEYLVIEGNEFKVIKLTS